MSHFPSDERSEKISLRILVVEDHDALREAMSRYLTRLGHEVCSTTTLATARRELQSSVPGGYQLLIVDMELPDGAGLDLLAMVPANCGFVTCSGFPQQLLPQRSAPWLMHLEKPFHIDELAAALRKGRAFLKMGNPPARAFLAPELEP